VTQQLYLEASEVKTVYEALTLAHECLFEGLKQSLVTEGYTPTQLAELEEQTFRFADLKERFKGIMP
jgi:hypothetical protein